MQIIPYRIIKHETFLRYRASYDVEIDLIDGRLPNEAEITAIAKRLRSRRHDKTFVCFYLPGMVIDAGAFAIGHHVPGLQVEIHEERVPRSIVVLKEADR